MYKEISFACGWPDGRMGGRAGGRADRRTHGRVDGRNGRAGLENLIILPLVTKAQFFQTTSKSKLNIRNYDKNMSAKIPAIGNRKTQKTLQNNMLVRCKRHRFLNVNSGSQYRSRTQKERKK